MATACACGCVLAGSGATHAVMAALAVGDLSLALDAGLLDCAPCPACSPGCTTSLQAARDARLQALAARDRYRARAARLARRALERNAKRAVPDGPLPSAADAAPPAPALPPAAAAALARAKARAAQRGPG